MKGTFFLFSLEILEYLYKYHTAAGLELVGGLGCSSAGGAGV